MSPTVHFRQKKLFIKHTGERVDSPIFAGGRPSPASLISSAPEIVSVEDDGKLVARSVGTATISSGSEQLQVSVLDIRALRLSPGKLDIPLGGRARVAVSNSDGSAIDNDALEWSSTSPAIASVQGPDVISGGRAGEAHIHARYGSMEAAIPVFVEPAKPAPLSFQIAPDHLRVGGVGRYALTKSPPAVSWSSSNSRILAMQSAGIFRARGTGMATVCVFAGSSGHTCVDVEVTK